MEKPTFLYFGRFLNWSFAAACAAGLLLFQQTAGKESNERGHIIPETSVLQRTCSHEVRYQRFLQAPEEMHFYAYSAANDELDCATQCYTRLTFCFSAKFEKANDSAESSGVEAAGGICSFSYYRRHCARPSISADQKETGFSQKQNYSRIDDSILLLCVHCNKEFRTEGRAEAFDKKAATEDFEQRKAKALFQEEDTVSTVIQETEQLITTKPNNVGHHSKRKRTSTTVLPIVDTDFIITATTANGEELEETTLWHLSKKSQKIKPTLIIPVDTANVTDTNNDVTVMTASAEDALNGVSASFDKDGQQSANGLAAGVTEPKIDKPSNKHHKHRHSKPPSTTLSPSTSAIIPSTIGPSDSVAGPLHNQETEDNSTVERISTETSTIASQNIKTTTASNAGTNAVTLPSKRPKDRRHKHLGFRSNATTKSATNFPSAKPTIVLFSIDESNVPIGMVRQKPEAVVNASQYSASNLLRPHFQLSACKGKFHYESRLMNATEGLRVFYRVNTNDALECAKLCYRMPFCVSAKFELNDCHFSYERKLCDSQADITPTDIAPVESIVNENYKTVGTSNRYLLFCIKCDQNHY